MRNKNLLLYASLQLFIVCGTSKWCGGGFKNNKVENFLNFIKFFSFSILSIISWALSYLSAICEIMERISLNQQFLQIQKFKREFYGICSF
jgi:hypothetical protein